MVLEVQVRNLVANEGEASVHSSYPVVHFSTRISSYHILLLLYVARM